MSTKAQLREAIKREVRVKTSTNLDAMIDDIMADIMRDYCNKSRYYEVLLENVPVVLVKGQQAYTLPVDFQNMAAVRYGRGPSPTSFRRVVPQPEQVRQTFNSGYPMYYRLVGAKISLWPYDAVVVADQLLIDYYRDPATLFTTEGSVFPIARLESAVKKDTIARVQRFHSAHKDAQMTDRDGEASFNAAEGGGH